VGLTRPEITSLTDAQRLDLLMLAGWYHAIAYVADFGNEGSRLGSYGSHDYS
jgi:hypothetical protein